MQNSKDRKKALRLVNKAKRGALTRDFVSQGSTRITKRLLAWDDYKKAKVIMTYLAMDGEPSVDEIIKRALQEGKIVGVPVCTEKPGVMVAARIEDLSAVVLGTYGIRMPKEPYETVSPESIDMVLIPGVAFDRWGGRLGMGAGYYDRFLATTNTDCLVGITWEELITSEYVPVEPHDKRVKAIITERRLIKCEEADF